jgi:transcriptional regulator of NAD metabolism
VDGVKRRREILKVLNNSKEPVTGSTLAKDFNVTRQVIVQDVAILRAEGKDIIATPQGYMMAKNQEKKLRQVIACQHDDADLINELYIIVDNGGTVVDVIVEHPVYGELRGILNLKSRYDVNQFMEKMESSKAKPLCFLTEGVHLHTIEADEQTIFQHIVKDLHKAGILLFFDK